MFFSKPLLIPHLFCVSEAVTLEIAPVIALLFEPASLFSLDKHINVFRLRQGFGKERSTYYCLY